MKKLEKKKLAMWLGAIMLLLTMVMPVHAAEFEDGVIVHIDHNTGGNRLQAEGEKTVWASTDTTGASVEWRLVDAGAEGVYFIEHASSGKRLSSAGVLGPEEGKTSLVDGSTDNDNVKWKIVDASGEWKNIVHVASELNLHSFSALEDWVPHVNSADFKGPNSQFKFEVVASPATAAAEEPAPAPAEPAPAQQQPAPTSNPQTGDMGMSLYIMLIVVSGGAIFVLALKRRAKQSV